ncbi:methyl-accepting chemotaxis protein [Polynucleobacter tropicus]|uniref:Methyl-accepting chemotaxis protein n=1 Tax=Polynucleobacter tropicus TaxID=1743174 RepID=A0A6M9Q4S9_9BURK|nr:methyl-accepting chemotaxis protein [Polynucleobacter tropicus]QKM65256.1 methyl-accepting chemotaxis protein [Polynucleobacter tropicus]
MIKNLSIKNKLILLVSPLLFFICLIGWDGMKTTNEGEKALTTMYVDRVECLGQLLNVRDGYSIYIMGATRKLVARSIGYDEALKSFDEGQALIEREWKTYLSTYLVPEEAAKADMVKEKMRAAEASLRTLRQNIKDKDGNAIARFADRGLAEAIDPIVFQLSGLSALQVRVAKEVYDEHLVTSSLSKKFLIAMIVLAIAISAYLSYKIILMITKPLEIANNAIEKMAAGNLDIEISDDGSHDEIGQIIRSTAAITKTLQKVERDLREQINAAKEGSLSARADARQHPGAFGNLVNGVNELMENLTAPMNEIANVMAKLASGDIRGRITGDYAGELKALKANVNRSLDALVSLLDSISNFATTIAKGDLTYQIEGNFQGEFAAIKQNLNAAVNQLSGVLNNVIETTEKVTVSATQTSAASKDVSEHAHNQTVNLVEISAAIEQTVSAISEIVRSTEKGAALAQKAADAAENGEETLSALSETVNGISEKNKQINQISELIGDIAEKTYVLALNAGLEALRAGNEGAGFGLIANKITALAEEVAEATRSIKSLISEATDTVEEGVHGAGSAKTAIHEIVDLSRQNGTTVQSIATSVEQQNSMMKTLKDKVLELKLIGQSTAAAAEEISVTMQSLVGTAQSLKKETDRIKTS